MWKSLAGWIQGQVTMAQDLARLQKEVSEMRERQEETSRVLERVLFSLQRESDQWRHEHANLLLKFEIELLKLRAQAPPRSDDEPKLRD